jgi:hypothetical protein
MTKDQLLADLRAENESYEALLREIGEARMSQPIAEGQWSIKDIVAHLAGWRRRTVKRLQAAARGEPEPAAPWPAHLDSDEAINAWLHEQTRDQPLPEVLAASRQVFDDLLAATEALPEADLQDPQRFPWLGGQAVSAAGLFGHFHEEHEADMRRWAAQRAG